MSNKIAKAILKHNGGVVEVDSFNGDPLWSVCDIKKLYPYIHSFVIKPKKNTNSYIFKFNLKQNILVVNYNSDYLIMFNKTRKRVHNIIIPDYYIDHLTVDVVKERFKFAHHNIIVCWL